MTRRIFQFAAALVLTLATLTPLMEMFDHWDKNVVPANDTELNLTAWFVGVGVVLTLSKLLRYIPPLARWKERRSDCCQAKALRVGKDEGPAPTGSPPLVPLRI